MSLTNITLYRSQLGQLFPYGEKGRELFENCINRHVRSGDLSGYELSLWRKANAVELLVQSRCQQWTAWASKTTFGSLLGIKQPITIRIRNVSLHLKLDDEEFALLNTWRQHTLYVEADREWATSPKHRQTAPRKKMKQVALSGYALAQQRLGSFYLTIAYDEVHCHFAATWLERAKDQELPHAEYQYAHCLENGIGVRQDGSAALKLYKKASPKYPDALKRLVNAYETGAHALNINKKAGLEKNPYLKKAIELGVLDLAILRRYYQQSVSTFTQIIRNPLLPTGGLSHLFRWFSAVATHPGVTTNERDAALNNLSLIRYYLHHKKEIRHFNLACRKIREKGVKIPKLSLYCRPYQKNSDFIKMELEDQKAVIAILSNLIKMKSPTIDLSRQLEAFNLFLSELSFYRIRPSFLDPKISALAIVRNKNERNGSFLFSYFIEKMNEGKLPVFSPELLDTIPPWVIGELCLELYEHRKENRHWIVSVLKEFIGKNPYIQIKNHSIMWKDPTICNKSISIDKRKLYQLIEVLWCEKCRDEPPFFKLFVPEDQHSYILDTTHYYLRTISYEDWPSKGKLLTDVLEYLPFHEKVNLSMGLQSSSDPKTRQLGKDFQSALEAPSFTAAIPFFYRLKESLPHMNVYHFLFIFKKPFEKLVRQKFLSQAPSFVRRIQYNTPETVTTFKSLVILVDKRQDHVKIPPYLLAYDTKQRPERLRWGVELKYGYQLKRVGDQLALFYKNSQTVTLIDLKKGTIDGTFELPYYFKHLREVHLHYSGHFFQLVTSESTPSERVLIGGKVGDRCIKRFGSFSWCESIPLDTHFGLLQAKILRIFNKNGNRGIIMNCHSAVAHQGKIYILQEGPPNEYLLTIRTLLDNSEVVSSVENEILFTAKNVRIDTVCRNGTVVLFGGVESLKYPIFIYPESKKVIYSSHKIPDFGRNSINNQYGNSLVIPMSGEVWAWDNITYKIWRIKDEKVFCEGTLKSERGTTFLHLTPDRQLYFIDEIY